MKIGAHEAISGGVNKAISRALQDKCESLQIFVKMPNRWRGGAFKDQEIESFLSEGKKFGFENMTAHASYLINLASPKEEVRENSLKGLKEELERCDSIGVPYYVLHPGSPIDSGYEAGVRRIVYGIDQIYSESNIKAMVLLEITSGSGTIIGSKLEELQEIGEKVKFSDKVGLCLDTCHMYSAGYDIVDHYDKVMEEVFSRFGDKLKVFHLNDSKHPLGSRKDRHELIGKGTIGLETFRRIVKDERLKNVLGILETPVEDMYAEEISLLKSLRG